MHGHFLDHGHITKHVLTHVISEGTAEPVVSSLLPEESALLLQYLKQHFASTASASHPDASPSVQPSSPTTCELRSASQQTHSESTSADVSTPTKPPPHRKHPSSHAKKAQVAHRIDAHSSPSASIEVSEASTTQHVLTPRQDSATTANYSVTIPSARNGAVSQYNVFISIGGEVHDIFTDADGIRNKNFVRP